MDSGWQNNAGVRVASFETSFREIAERARTGGLESQIAVYNLLSHMFLEGSHSLKPDDEALLFQLFDTISFRIPEHMRIDLARRVARADNPPLILAERLALDTAPVAVHVLKRIPFDEAQLLKIIAGTPLPHHLIIAERAELTPKVWAALAQRPGEQAVAKTREGDVEEAPAEIMDEATSPETSVEEGVAVAKDALDASALDIIARPRPGAPTRKIKARPNKMPPPIEGWSWQTDRQGRITMISEGATRAFGLAPSALQGLFFFTQVEGQGADPSKDPLATAVSANRPIRDVAVVIEDRFGRLSEWQFRGKAQFDRRSGKFQGYLGTARPLGEADRTAPHRSSNTGEPAAAALAEKLDDEAQHPIAQTVQASERALERAKAISDYGLIGDISIVLEEIFRLRDMMGDARRIINAWNGIEYGERQTDTINLLQCLKECLKLDAVRRGGMSRFQIRPSAMNVRVLFDEELLKEGICRALEAVRRAGRDILDRGIGVTAGKLGCVEIRLPFGTGNTLDEDGLFPSYQRLRNGLTSPLHFTPDNVFSPVLGLTALRSDFATIGGDIFHEQLASGAAEVVIVLPIA